MSYWPAFDCPSWNALAKSESYGSVRNSTVMPVACWNAGMIVPLNGTSAPSSNAPITSLPPVDGATLATPPPVEAAGADAALDAAADGDALAPQAARNALDAATPPTA